MIRVWGLLFVILPVTVCAQENLDTSRAQVQMLQRISSVVNQRAQQLGLSQDVVTYCRIELNNKTDQFPRNGSIPFGINYNQISDERELDRVISSRESYEKTFMLLCLSRAKRELSVGK